MILKIKKITEDAKIPVYAVEGDAGMDLFSNEDVVVRAGEIKAISTGIAMEIPDGFVGLVWDKSGVSFKNDVKTLGGVIDSGYRGEVKVIMKNLSNKDFKVEKGQKIAQMLIQKFESPKIEVVEQLDQTERGDGAFGHTGLF